MLRGRGSLLLRQGRVSALSCAATSRKERLLSAHPSSQRIAIARAVLALVWAAAVVVAIGDRVPTTDEEIPVAAAVLLAAYPLIDVAASLASARRLADATALRVNATIST